MKNFLQKTMVPSLAAAAVVAVLFSTISVMNDSSILAWLPVATPLAFVAAAAHALLLGAPLLAALRRAGRLRWWTASLTGALVGVLPALVFGTVRDEAALLNATTLWAIAGLLGLGAAGGLAFWSCSGSAPPTEPQQPLG